MPPRDINRDNLLAVRLLQLRRHFNTCDQCAAAVKAHDFDLMCKTAKDMLVEVAMKWMTNITGRLAARRSDQDHIFPCPDPNAHGPAYAITAEACIVVARQDRIF